jgi:di/tricarboxylate transporter
MHLVLAAAAKVTVWEKIKAVPLDTWIGLAIAILVIFVLVRLWKNLREFNEFAPWIALFMIGGSVILYWTYERTEPKLLTPVINVLSQYLPSKIPYQDADNPH